MFEFTVAFSFSMLAGYLVLARRYPIRSIGFIPLGVALALLLYASSLPSEIEPLVPALQNAPLLTIHVGMAVLSYGIFATSFAAGVAYLVQGQNDRFAWLPSHKVLDEVAYRAVIIGFPIFATMIILGSWWASIAWSRYWGWDPKETAALVTWLTYAVYLHARNQRSWAGRPAALLLVVGLRDGARHVLRARSGSAACTPTAGSGPLTSARQLAIGRDRSVVSLVVSPVTVLADPGSLGWSEAVFGFLGQIQTRGVRGSDRRPAGRRPCRCPLPAEQRAREIGSTMQAELVGGPADTR